MGNADVNHRNYSSWIDRRFVFHNERKSCVTSPESRDSGIPKLLEQVYECRAVICVTVGRRWIASLIFKLIFRTPRKLQISSCSGSSRQASQPFFQLNRPKDCATQENADTQISD